MASECPRLVLREITEFGKILNLYTICIIEAVK